MHFKGNAQGEFSVVSRGLIMCYKISRVIGAKMRLRVILSHAITHLGGLNRIYYEIFVKRQFVLRRWSSSRTRRGDYYYIRIGIYIESPRSCATRVRDSISFSARSEVSRQWLLSHFRFWVQSSEMQWRGALSSSLRRFFSSLFFSVLGRGSVERGLFEEIGAGEELLSMDSYVHPL